ncbi:hypothetical protein DFH06DRAFT_1279778 [Mycena polygramma]|nr:hypothetical protein DFH06DRAFT_1279778 [Mycena polygramma]
MAAAGSQSFSSIAGGITDVSPASTLASADPPPSNPAVPDAQLVPAPVLGGDGIAPPTKRPVGRPKGSKNKSTLANPNANGEKRPVGRPRGSGKKKAESDSPKRPVGRPRKDGLPPGGPSQPTYTTLVPPAPDYYRIAQSVPPVQQWVPFPGSISAPPPAPVVDPALERLGHNEWADLAHSNPAHFLHVLLAALDVPNPLPLAGPSVEEAFKSHLGSLAPPPSSTVPNSANGAPPPAPPQLPSLYSILKTFWLPSSPSYFALTASATRVISSARFLYWDPQPLVFNGIGCPTCAAPLANRGRIRSGPITVHDLAGPFFVIGCAYACANGHAYASTDDAVRRALPAALEREFPARLLEGDTGVDADVWNWQARGVSRALWNLVLGSLRAGLPREVILQLVRDVQHGVPEAAVKEEQLEPAAPMEEEETAEEAAEGRGQGDVAMEAGEGAESTVTSATQAFNDAWAANSVITNADLRNNPYARLAMPGMFAQTMPVAGMVPYDAAQRKRPYPFGEQDGASGSGTGSEVAADGADAGAAATPTKTRNPRHCCKCGLQTCKGKGGRNFCQNPCMDCGKFECRGRNSRRPDKKCDSGWPEDQPLAQDPQQQTVV